MKLKIKRAYEDSPDLLIPTEENIGYDLVSHSISDHNSQFIEYDTGLIVEPPKGYHVEIFPRSSISKYDLILANSIGLIDPSFRNTLKLRFKYIGSGTKHYDIGDRIGQLVIRKTEKLEVEYVDSLSETERGDKGFGSSGS